MLNKPVLHAELLADARCRANVVLSFCYSLKFQKVSWGIFSGPAGSWGKSIKPENSFCARKWNLRFNSEGANLTCHISSFTSEQARRISLYTACKQTVPPSRLKNLEESRRISNFQ